MGSGIGSSPNPELAAALHRLRSTLARVRAELELATLDATALEPGKLMQDVREALDQLATVEDSALRERSVLVVDDDSRLAELTARGLRRLGFDARPDNGLGTLRPRDVVVFDLSLAGSLSADALKSLKAARPIVVTGATDSASRGLAAGLDAADYLVKPVELDELAGAIRRHVAGD